MLKPGWKKVDSGQRFRTETGDLIVEVNNNKVDTAYDLMNEVENSMGENIWVKYKRGNSYNNTKVTPVKSAEDNKYRVGMW